MKRKIALAMVLAMTASMAQPVLAADSKTTLDVIISQYGTQTQTWWTQFEKDFEAENPDIDLNVEIVSWNDLYTKVNTLVANNNAPDILNIDVLADYVADDLLMPATEYASEDLQAKFFRHSGKQAQSMILYTHYRSWHPAVLSSITKISLMKQALPFLLHGLKFRKQHRRSKINSVMTFIHGVLI